MSKAPPPSTMRLPVLTKAFMARSLTRMLRTAGIEATRPEQGICEGVEQSLGFGVQDHDHAVAWLCHLYSDR
jgi:hypothetical protein